jgi:RNA polymerase sigma factor (sigma-70 family)
VSPTDLELLYHEQGKRLWWALLAYTGDPESASDALAESFARALASRASMRDLSAWVWRVAFRVATTEMKRERPAPQVEPSYEIDPQAFEVLHALGSLSRNQRAVVVLFYYADRPTKEIAQLLGMSAPTVSVHLHRARQRLRTLLGDEHD